MRAINLVNPHPILEARISREVLIRHNTGTIKAMLGVNNKKLNRRNREHVIPRQIGIVMAYLFTEESTTTAAGAFGKDHAMYSHCKNVLINAIRFNDRLIMPDLINVFKVLYNSHIHLVRIYKTLKPADQRMVDRVAARLDESEIAQKLIKIVKGK